MVNGIESFVRKFRDYADCYTIIGGAACDMLCQIIRFIKRTLNIVIIFCQFTAIRK